MSTSTPYEIDDDQLFNNQAKDQEQHNVSKPSSGKITNYTTVNFIGFIFSCFSVISFAVFLTATQTYFMTDVLGISDKLGSYIGTLGFYDELLAIILVPLIGTLSDKIGSRPIQVVGSIAMGLSFFGYATFARSVYPGMLFWRLVFCVGAASSTSTMMVMLIELNNSNFKIEKFTKFLSRNSNSGTEETDPLQQNDEGDEDDEEEASTQEAVNKINKSKKEGRTTSLMGISSGLGAIFAVAIYLRFPITFGETNPAGKAMRLSYYTVGLIAFGTAAILFFILYKDDKKRWFKDDIEELFEGLEDDETLVGQEKKENYLEALKHGATISIKNPVILMSYLGSFMARISTIIIAVFIPFYINNYFFKSGKCSTHEADKLHCRDSFILSSILTGISQTVCLILAPVVGILIDRLNNHLHLLLVTNAISMISAIGMSFISKPDESIMIYIWVSLLGFTQISFILVSMTILSNINSREKYYNYKGSISGVYSLFGGVGILIMNKLGGLFGDMFISGPFMMLLICNGIFFACMFILKGTKENDERTFRSILQKITHRG